MELPKTLLYAILVGIATTAAVSCTDENDPKPEAETEEQMDMQGCPACGMG